MQTCAWPRERRILCTQACRKVCDMPFPRCKTLLQVVSADLRFSWFCCKEENSQLAATGAETGRNRGESQHLQRLGDTTQHWHTDTGRQAGASQHLAFERRGRSGRHRKTSGRPRSQRYSIWRLTAEAGEAGRHKTSGKNVPGDTQLASPQS